jgi:hypothetical protein
MKEISRRDFLKLSSLMLVSSMMYKPMNLLSRYINNGLPKYFQDILNDYRNFTITNGILKVDSSTKFELIQTEINKINLKLAETKSCYKCKETTGIVFHSFDATDYLLSKYIPDRTAEEYVKNGFGKLTSAMFLVGDDKFDIVQCEILTPDNKTVPSAHCVEVRQDEEYTNKQFYLQAMNNTCYQFGFPNNIATTQRLHKKGNNSAPNRSTIGIEITGIDFDNNPISTRKISNLLSLSIALIKYYKISPALDFYGHKELDLKKSDPGRRLVYLMKLLVGICALEDDELKQIIFGKFKNVNQYFDFATEYFKKVSDAKEANDYLNEIEYDKIIGLIS